MNKKLKKILIVLPITLLIVFILQLAYKGYQSHNILGRPAFNNMALGICGEKPNCISSMQDQTDKKHYMPPLDLHMSPLLKIDKLLIKTSGYKLVKQEHNYRYYTVTSKFFRFVDDLEIFYDIKTKRLHYRSASRVGYSDMDANRKRINYILKNLN